MSTSLTIVLKVGSSSISSSLHLNLSCIVGIVEVAVSLRAAGHRVVIVSSGAVSVGCQRLGLQERPKDLVTKQAVAAVGQGRLMKVRVMDRVFVGVFRVSLPCPSLWFAGVVACLSLALVSVCREYASDPVSRASWLALDPDVR